MKAVIFDMDGTLVDTKKIHLDAWQKVFKNHGYSLPKKIINNYFGVLDYYVFSKFFKEKGIKDDPMKWCIERSKITGKKMRSAKLFPGAKTLLNCIPKNVKVALGTSSTKKEMLTVFNNNHLKKYFDIILTKEDVKQHKPNPELYLKIAKKLKVSPKDCIVIEDSIAGVEAAKRAGMFCVATLTSYPASKLKRADLRVRNLKSKAIKNLICANY
jgi:beta-phosphoglucomutase family hydrolase